jgi:D-sedoheptulose 7-phosphate isomerase
MDKIRKLIKEDIAVKERLLATQAANIKKAAGMMISSIKKGGKVILFGNGGSAADAQHIAAELVGRFRKERKALRAVALTVNTSTLTAIANDYGYENVFKRQLEALAGERDVIIAISTSGNAKNVIEAVNLANRMGLVSIGLTGSDGGRLAKVAKLSIIVPSKSTPRIQESHIVIGHILCELVEELF